MSAELSSGQSSGRAAGLTLNLSSNNPFRNRAQSPSSFSPPPPRSPFDDPLPARPVSRNPFLDPSNNHQRAQSQDNKMASPQDRPKSPTAEELFDKLTLEEKKAALAAVSGSAPASGSGSRPAPPRPQQRPMNRPPGAPPRGENIPPRDGRGPPPQHRPRRSQEDGMRSRRMPGGSNGGDKNIFDSPQRRPDRRPRRNSESSVVSAERPMTEEEKKQREMRRRDRERRHRDMKEKSSKPSRRLDLIDQLDATGIYGAGLFHHDGPFDALNPHRNRKGNQRAPMQAFPKDSLNNSLGGAGPLNARPDHAALMGNHDDEAFKDYAVSGKDKEPQHEPVFDPTARGTVLHGDESMGLGTSTFLEGTPAARTAIQRRQAETAQDTLEQGLQRKKSLAQRIRGINRGPRDLTNTGRMTNPESAYGPQSGGSLGGGDGNPFFNNFEKTSNEERISVRTSDSNPMSPMSPNSPTRGKGLERRATTDSTDFPSDGAAPAKPVGNGLLARVKSLKGGRRQRPEIPAGPPPAAPTPGTAV